MSSDVSGLTESVINMTLQQPNTATQIFRDPDLWFDQGDLVLRAESTIFRVMKESLADQSLVFRDMATLPTPEVVEELIDGCPVVGLTDSERDIHSFLEAIFIPG